MHEFNYECNVCGEGFTELAHIGRAEESPPCPLPDCSGIGMRVYEMPEVIFAEQRNPLSIFLGSFFGGGVDEG